MYLYREAKAILPKVNLAMEVEAFRQVENITMYFKIHSFSCLPTSDKDYKFFLTVYYLVPFKTVVKKKKGMPRNTCCCFFSFGICVVNVLRKCV